MKIHFLEGSKAQKEEQWHSANRKLKLKRQNCTKPSKAAKTKLKYEIHCKVTDQKLKC